MEKHADLLTKIENMSVLELNDLVKAIEEKFGVSAAAVAAAPCIPHITRSRRPGTGAGVPPIVHVFGQSGHMVRVGCRQAPGH